MLIFFFYNQILTPFMEPSVVQSIINMKVLDYFSFRVLLGMGEYVRL